MALKFCKNTVQKQKKAPIESQAIGYNNLASIYRKKLVYQKAFAAQMRGLEVIENQVRKKIFFK